MISILVFVIIGVCVLIETMEQIFYRLAGRHQSRYAMYVALAITLHLTGLTFWYWLLKWIPLSIALPMMGLSYATIALASYYFFGEKIRMRRWIGISCIIFGFILISLYEQQS